jgi:hypothetical protein
MSLLEAVLARATDVVSSRLLQPLQLDMSPHLVFKQSRASRLSNITAESVVGKFMIVTGMLAIKLRQQETSD